MDSACSEGNIFGRVWIRTKRGVELRGEFCNGQIPELFASFRERFPPTKEFPNATASAYLESRGLDPSKIQFRQSSFQIAQEEFSTVAFELAPGILNHRLIDYAGKDKSRNIGSYKGKVCPTYQTLDPKKPLWITEGYIDALSLADAKVGAQAAATLSAAHTPAEFLLGLPTGLKAVVLAFDSDHAGSQATRNQDRNLAEMTPAELAAFIDHWEGERAEMAKDVTPASRLEGEEVEDVELVALG